MNSNSPLIFIIVSGLVLLAWKELKKTNHTTLSKERLIKLLEKAENLVANYSGGYSGEYLSAEEFHKALKTAIKDYKEGDNSQIDDLYFWFSPTCQWDDFAGREGEYLGNEIFELLTRMKNQTSHP